MTKHAVLFILFFGFFEFSASSYAMELTSDDEPILNYLSHEAESLRYRRLYAAEAKKNMSCKSSDLLEKEQLNQRAKDLEIEARHGSELQQAIHKAIEAQSQGNDPQKRKELCLEGIRVYSDAIDMIQKLKAAGYLKADSAKYLVDRYKWSDGVMKILCKTRN